jgi:hypothetical protein
VDFNELAYKVVQATTSPKEPEPEDPKTPAQANGHRGGFMSAIDITGVVTASPSIAMFRESPALGSEANYEAPARQALAVERSRTEDGGLLFTVSDPVTGIFGTGSAPIDAVQDLARAQKEHQEVLEAQESLSPALEEQLRYLQRR